MTAVEKKTSGNGIGIFSLLGLAFVILKLCHVIAWSWVWVVAPFWIPLAFIGVVFLFMGFAAFLARSRS